MNTSSKATKSVFVIVLFSLISKLLGFMREMLIGAKFGSGMETDTFFLSLSAVSLFTTVLTASLGTTMIPILSEIGYKKGMKRKIEFTNNILGIVSLFSICLISFAWVLAPYILKILAPGFSDNNQFKLAIILMRITLPTVIFASIQGILRGFLQSENRFEESAASNFPFNIVYIFYLLILSSYFGIKGLAVAHVIASFSMLTFQIISLYKMKFKFEINISFKDNYLRKMLSLLPPILLSIGISDLNKIIDKALASTLIDGSISALNYAARLDGLVRGLFVAAITTVLYPMLAEEASKNNYEGLKKVTIKGLNIILLITIPATVGMIILANPIVKVAFERGVFDTTATAMTTGALVFTVIGMVGTSLGVLLNNVYYSLQDTKTPVKIGFVAVIINIIFNFILIKPMAHMGLALATSISAIALAILLIYGLREKQGSFGFMQSVSCGLKSFVASLIMGGIVFYINKLLSNSLGSGRLMELLSLLVAISIGVSIYIFLIILFKVKEVEWAINLFKKRKQSF